jgi:flagellar basal-body rod modification protein FlgD
MSTINPTSPTSSTDQTTNKAATTSTDKSTLGSEQFLKLLTIQLANQDPFNPMDDTEFISQMANFSSLEEMSKLSNNFSSFSAKQEQLSSQAFLGKEVTISQGTSDDITGTVSSVSIDKEGSIFVTVDGTQYSVSDITSVALAETASE